MSKQLIIIILLFLSAFSFHELHKHKIMKPYIILFENPTEEDFEHCRADFPNCMDVMATRDLLKHNLEKGEK